MICYNPQDEYNKCFVPCSDHIKRWGQCTCHNAFINSKIIENKEKKVQMSKQTAVEWLIEHFKEYGFDLRPHQLEIEQAKVMEKEQIMNAFLKQSPIEDGVMTAVQKAEQYYNQTYGGEK